MFPTNDDLTCVAIQGLLSGYAAIKADIAAGFDAYLDQVPAVADRVRAGRREERWLGTGNLPNVVRQASGPGWALVGDTGCVKDPAPALALPPEVYETRAAMRAQLS